MVYLTQLDNIQLSDINYSYIVDLFQAGVDKISLKDLKIINEERKKNNKEPLTSSEIKAYIDSLHDYNIK